MQSTSLALTMLQKTSKILFYTSLKFGVKSGFFGLLRLVNASLGRFAGALV